MNIFANQVVSAAATKDSLIFRNRLQLNSKTELLLWTF